MSHPIYFIISSAGTAGNSIGDMIHSTHLDNNMPSLLNTYTYDAEVPEVLTEDFIYNHIQIDNSAHAHVINLHVYPNCDRLKERFPDCKIIIVTHNICDIVYNFSHNVYRSFYIDLYDAGISKPWFDDIIASHPRLFSNPTVRPDELTGEELLAFKLLIQHQKLLDGFWNITVPDTATEIRFFDIIRNPAATKSTMVSLLGMPLGTTALANYNAMYQSSTSYFQHSYQGLFPIIRE